MRDYVLKDLIISPINAHDGSRLGERDSKSSKKDLQQLFAILIGMLRYDLYSYFVWFSQLSTSATSCNAVKKLKHGHQNYTKISISVFY